VGGWYSWSGHFYPGARRPVFFECALDSLQAAIRTSCNHACHAPEKARHGQFPRPIFRHQPETIRHDAIQDPLETGRTCRHRAAALRLRRNGGAQGHDCLKTGLSRTQGRHQWGKARHACEEAIDFAQADGALFHEALLELARLNAELGD